MASKVIDSIWHGIKIPILGMRTIGIVAVQCEVTGKIKFYIGLGRGENTQQDEQAIYNMGVPFYPSIVGEWLYGIESFVNEGANKGRTRGEQRANKMIH